MIFFFAVVSFGFAIWREYFYHVPIQVEYMKIENENSRDNDNKLQEEEKTSNQNAYRSNTEQSQTKLPEAPFNPNNLQVEDWQEMGFSKKQAQVIVNFKTARGGFKTKEDVQSVFVIDDEFYTKIKPFLDLPTRNEYLSSFTNSYEEKDSTVTAEKVVIELNSATLEELKKLRGIGDYRAKQIIELRNKLGGYNDIIQIKGVYHFPEEVFQEIQSQLEVDISAIVKMDLNQVSYEMLKNHPLISSLQAKSIIELREQIGEYQSVDELIKTTHIDLRTYKELKDYFEVNTSNDE